MPARRVSYALLSGLLLCGEVANAKNATPQDSSRMGDQEWRPFVEVGPDRLILGDPMNDFVSGARVVSHKRGFFDVIGHGNEQVIGIQFGVRWRDFRAPELAELIRQAGWNGRDAIRLISCETGAGENPIGAQLARILGVPVLAPRNFGWAEEDGRIDVQYWVGGMRARGRERWAYFSARGVDLANNPGKRGARPRLR
jgi:hypothetical protein